MLGDRDRVMRVGIWVIVVAAVAGLLALVFSAKAWADQPDRMMRVDSLLLDRTPISSHERFDAARELLRAEDRERRWALWEASLRTGWQFWGQGSPGQLLRSAGRLADELWSWQERSVGEDVALDLLETGIASGGADARLLELYTGLREREIEERAAQRLRAAEEALEAGHLGLARARLERSLALAPDSKRAQELLSRLLREEKLATAPEADPRPVEAESWEGPLATSLLSGDYERTLALGGGEPEALLAHSVAHYLSGEPAPAYLGLSSLADRDDSVGQTARVWIERPEFTARRRFAAERRRYRVRTTLGWLGGAPLAKDGLKASTSGYEAWRESITPLNLVLSLPARIFRGWRPDGEALREAAATYLDLDPHGDDAESAREWLTRLGAARDRRIEQALESGRLELPEPRTRYRRLEPGPLILTRSVIESEQLSGSPLLRDVLGEADAVILRPIQDALDLPLLPSSAAQELLMVLAGALEEGHLESLGLSGSASLEGLSRLDRAIQRGYSIAASAWQTKQVGGTPSMRATAFSVSDTLLRGGSRSFDGVSVSRSGDDLRLDRGFGSPGFACPDEAVCLNRTPWVRGDVYGFAEVDGHLHLGAQAEFQQASVAIDLSGSGPQASVQLPLARWIGLERWLPVAARVEVGTESVYLGPVVVVPDREERSSSSFPGVARLKDLAKRFQ